MNKDTAKAAEIGQRLEKAAAEGKRLSKKELREMANELKKCAENDPYSYDNLFAFHGCEDLIRVKPDEKGDQSCGAHLCEGWAFPCRMNNEAKLRSCADYCGKLKEKIRGR